MLIIPIKITLRRKRMTSGNFQLYPQVILPVYKATTNEQEPASSFQPLQQLPSPQNYRIPLVSYKILLKIPCGSVGKTATI